MAGLFEELRRRNVFRVGAAYLVVAWLILQIAATAFPALHLPHWTVTFVTVLLILGLPIALILAWAYEVTPEGVKRTRNVPLEASVTRMTGRKLDFLIIGMLAVAVVGMVFHNYVRDEAPSEGIVSETESRAQRSIESPVDNGKSIAVLPFVNMSADKEQEFFADGITEEILNTLAAIEQLRVAGRTSSFQFKGTSKDLREIGKSLGVDNVLEGSVRRGGNKVRITTQLIETESGFHLWSGTFDRELDDIFAIQEEIAEAVAKALQVKLGIAVQQSVARRTTDNLEAYALYLQAIQYHQQADVGDLRKALEISRRVMLTDPDFLPGYVIYADSVMQLHSWGAETPGVSLDEIERLMRDVLARDPGFAEAWLTIGSSQIFRFELQQAEQSFAIAMELGSGTLAVSEEWSYALVAYMGRPAEAADLMEEWLAIEPLSHNTRGIYAETLSTLGRMQESEGVFRDLLEFDTDYSTAHFRIGTNYYLRLGRPADALPWYHRAIELDPENPWNLVDIAQAFYDLGATSDAEAATERLADSVTDSHVIAVFRYNLARRSGNEISAGSLRQYLAENVDRAVEGLHYFQTLEWLRNLQSSDPDRALALYRRIQPALFQSPPAIGPWNHGAALSLALLKRQTGALAEADALARAVLEVTDSTTEMYGYFGAPAVAWLVLEDENRAMQALEQAFRDQRVRWEWGFLEVDPVYDPLRGRPEFQALLDHIRADMAKQLQDYRTWEASEERPLVLDFTP